jgi:XTP/dITP diphosphohydrolase
MRRWQRLVHKRRQRIHVSSEHQRIVIASGNAGKVREISRILSGPDRVLISQAELGISIPPETGKTFVDNALIKARLAAEQSGLPAIADDSGLLVDALDGRPGVYSARYAGGNASDEQNIDKLLAELKCVPAEERGAHYECAAVWVSPEPGTEPLIAQGRWYGRIIEERRGSGGFGYDPVFLDMELMKTGAEMSADEKNRQSHRGKAFRALGDLLTP